MKGNLLSILGLFLGITIVVAQPERWQQRAVYQMEIDFDVTNHQFSGYQHLTYINNSPDQLTKVYYHLYLNAFQPGSMMDMRSITILDPDRRVRDRISNLKPTEIGYQKINKLTHNGKPVEFEIVGTILEVTLNEPIEPRTTAVFEMEFESQVPLQVRRNGRSSSEGIDYSMAQWYPKMCEYDYQGWHANPYIAREFYGVWGDFDVKITIDPAYTVAATGYLQNPNQIGYGYEDEGVTPPNHTKPVTWHFIAPNVHDFMWAADREYTHDKVVRDDGLVLHFFYQKNENTEEHWAMLSKTMDRAFDLINERFGQYPYKKYSFIQGGDGGMEYPMGTLITGERSFGSLVGVSVHELMHSWYQMVLGTNESLYAWMDEGFTVYASNIIENILSEEGLMGSSKATANPHANSYNGYFNLVKSGREEPLTTHSDHFSTNYAYGLAAYSKGAVFLHQLEYIIGRKPFESGLQDYFDQWKFKHPNANDCIRIFEKASGLELDWYKEYFVHTTSYVDYGVKSVEEGSDSQTNITLERLGLMPMPIDLMVTYTDGKQELLNIPLRMMRGEKAAENEDVPYQVLPDWPWTHPIYQFVLEVNPERIKSIEIDPSRRLADLDRQNNVFMK